MHTITRPIDELAATARSLDPADWTAHRAVAQEAAACGYTARVTQEFPNCVGLSTEHTTTIESGPSAGAEPIVEDFGPMGDSTSVETFTPDNPLGYYGRRTPLEYLP